MIALAFKNSQLSTTLGKNSNLSLKQQERNNKKIRTETSEVIKYRTVVNEIKNWVFEKINKIVKFLSHAD